MKKSFLFAAIVCVLIGFAGIFVAPRAFVNRADPAIPFQPISIPDNASASQIADLLFDAKIIFHPSEYKAYALIDDQADHPTPGVYQMKPGMSYRQIARMLARGPERVERSLTVIEGWGIREISGLLGREEVDVRPSDFFAERYAKDFSFLNGLPSSASLEGYLFPDTYRVWKDELPDALVRKQLQAFQKTTSGFEEELEKQHRSLRDVVILASIIEREVASPEDRKIVAGIFWNRLQAGMSLQSDATLNYVLGTNRSRLNIRDLESDSLYNTYKYKGLPPGPISNPGKDALEAALHPADTPYWYFLTDDQGKTYFARTLEEHARNRAKAFGP